MFPIQYYFCRYLHKAQQLPQLQRPTCILTHVFNEQNITSFYTNKNLNTRICVVDTHLIIIHYILDRCFFIYNLTSRICAS